MKGLKAKREWLDYLRARRKRRSVEEAIQKQGTRLLKMRDDAERMRRDWQEASGKIQLSGSNYTVSKLCERIRSDEMHYQAILLSDKHQYALAVLGIERAKAEVAVTKAFKKFFDTVLKKYGDVSIVWDKGCYLVDGKDIYSDPHEAGKDR